MLGSAWYYSLPYRLGSLMVLASLAHARLGMASEVGVGNSLVLVVRVTPPQCIIYIHNGNVPQGGVQVEHGGHCCEGSWGFVVAR